MATEPGINLENVAAKEKAEAQRTLSAILYAISLLLLFLLTAYFLQILAQGVVVGLQQIGTDNYSLPSPDGGAGYATFLLLFLAFFAFSIWAAPRGKRVRALTVRLLVFAVPAIIAFIAHYSNH